MSSIIGGKLYTYKHYIIVIFPLHQLSITFLSINPSTLFLNLNTFFYILAHSLVYSSLNATD